MPVIAQATENCAIYTEMRIDLKDPEIGSYHLWDTVYGDPKTAEVFKTGLPLALPSVQLMAVGEQIVSPAGEKMLVLAQIGRNGRVIKDRVHTVAGLTGVVKILPLGEDVLVFANRMVLETGRQVIWRGRFTLQGEKVSESDLEDNTGDLLLSDVVETKKTGEYLLSATIRKTSLQQPVSAVLYRTDSTGRVLADHAFVTGTENRLSGLKVLEDSGVLATGYAYGEDGRKNGWIVRLDNSFNIVWQNIYPRGMGAEFVTGAGMANNTLVVAGQAVPAGKKTLSGWVMVVQADNGAVGWQRFFSSPRLLRAQEITVSPEGLVSVLLDGEVPPASVTDAEQKPATSQAALLTLTPQGNLFSQDTHANAKGARVYDVVTGMNGDRFILGTTTIMRQSAPESGDASEPDTQGWIIAVPRMETYDDPCLRAPDLVP